MSLRSNKNFKSVFALGLFTNIGDSLFFIVTMWYIANNSSISLYAGIAVFLFTLPETLLIFLGPFIDRLNPKIILIVSTSGQIIVHIIIVLLFLTGLVTIPILLISLLLSAFFSSITYPVEETILPQIVENDDLVKANSFFSVAYKLSDSLFDGIAGILLVVGTASLLYEINLLIFVLPLIMLKFLKFNLQTENPEKFNIKSYKKDLKEGLSFILHSKIKLMLIPLAFLNFFTAINIVALPYFANELSDSPATYGFLLGFSGAGSMLGAIIVNKIEKRLLPGKILAFGLLFNGLMWFFMIISTVPYLAYLFIFLANFCMGGYNIIFASLFQVMTPSNLLGRINTCVDSVITVAMPIGALLGGILIEILSLKIVMSLNAIALVITGIIYFSNKTVYNLKKIETINPVNTDGHLKATR
ncbi:MFS transporter [Aquibacillus sp. 3ASR75-11]|uniref:MFS transporter n=1 Tax=Terrihalobacillus insolitus TaxID=2950438 RepID=A0A9X3WUF2_9BACI|nr:MFS transporter [Terrihalobacillus insolitus]MDC3424431.1 MFS transporter [Terrihalobacillus insolitus]